MNIRSTIIVLLMFASFAGGLVLVPHIVQAAATPDGRQFIPLADYSQSSKLSGLYGMTENGDLSELFNRLFIFAISIGGMLAVGRLLWAGYQYLGSDLWTKKETAKQDIKNIFLGLIILLGVWVILNEINPNLLRLSVSTPATPQITAPVSGEQSDPQSHVYNGVTFADAQTISPTVVPGMFCMHGYHPGFYDCYASEQDCRNPADALGTECITDSAPVGPADFVGDFREGEVPAGSYCYESSAPGMFACTRSNDSCQQALLDAKNSGELETDQTSCRGF